MMTLESTRVKLRALEPEDLDFLMATENDESLWHLSETQVPFSKHILQDYLNNAHQDIYESKQLRLVICDQKDEEMPLGFIDLFNFDPYHSRAGVGILIKSAKERGKGYGSEALDLVCTYAKRHLKLHQLFANISAQNIPSIKLFTSCGFLRTGIKKDWQHTAGGYADEGFYQKIL